MTSYMATTQHDNKAPAPVPSSKTVLLLIGTLVDTTLRLFVPTLSGLLIGFFLDQHFATKPFLSLAGITLGVVIAALLIYMQVKKINKEKT